MQQNNTHLCSCFSVRRNSAAKQRGAIGDEPVIFFICSGHPCACGRMCIPDHASIDNRDIIYDTRSHITFQVTQRRGLACLQGDRYRSQSARRKSTESLWLWTSRNRLQILKAMDLYTLRNSVCLLTALCLCFTGRLDAQNTNLNNLDILEPIVRRSPADDTDFFGFATVLHQIQTVDDADNVTTAAGKTR